VAVLLIAARPVASMQACGRNCMEDAMALSTQIIRAALLAAAAAILAAAAYQLREKHQEAELTVQSIHDQLDALDPATRAAVVARLTSDQVEKVRGRRQ
jgi:predicted ATPase